MMTNQEAQPPSGRCNPGAFKCPRGERSSDVDGRRPDKSDYLRAEIHDHVRELLLDGCFGFSCSFPIFEGRT